MADKKFKCVPFVTEVMTARYPRLSEPDTQGEYADGKYKTEATAGSDYTERLQDEIQRVAEANFPRKKHVHVPWRDTREGEIASSSSLRRCGRSLAMPRAILLWLALSSMEARLFAFRASSLLGRKGPSGAFRCGQMPCAS